MSTEAVQWFKSGDHPNDNVGETLTDPLGGPDYTRLEGAVVRFFRHPSPELAGDLVHDACGRTWHDHGYLDWCQVVVCPGDWVTADSEDPRCYRYATKPNVTS